MGILSHEALQNYFEQNQDQLEYYKKLSDKKN